MGERSGALLAAARRCGSEFRRRQRMLVLAESCTAGLAAATLATIPGASEYLCGSAVTYRNETKAAWLSVNEDSLADPGPVSESVAEQMVAGVLKSTPQADWAASITGHLGPGAPDGLDGVAFIGVGSRFPKTEIRVQSVRLQTTTREERQEEATLWLIRTLTENLMSLS